MSSTHSAGASPVSAPHPKEAPVPESARPVSAAAARARKRSSWLISLTAVCFLFGGLMAMQLRAIETVRENKQREAESLKNEQAMVAQMKKQIAAEAQHRKELEASLAAATARIKSGSSLSQQQVAKLNTEIKKMQVVAGLTPVTGPGIVMKLSDDPEVAKSGALPGGFAPGIVHDYDVLQVVNELRAAKAEAIAINGTRVTAYTPIRCVGPTILVNWEPAAAPFVIEAIGDPDRLASSVNMPNGIAENLRNNSLGVKVSKADELELPPAEGVPTMRVLKTEQS